eukprot:2734041-Rhodomonas_salina.1
MQPARVCTNAQRWVSVGLRVASAFVPENSGIRIPTSRSVRIGTNVAVQRDTPGTPSHRMKGCGGLLGVSLYRAR